MRVLQILSFAFVFFDAAEAVALSCRSALYNTQSAIKHSSHFFYAIDILFIVIAMTITWRRISLISKGGDKLFEKSKYKRLAKTLALPVFIILIPLGHIILVNIKIAACSINVP